MFRIISRRGSVAMAAATVGLAGMSLAFAAPAGATGTVSGPNASLIVGSGSQTSYDEMTALGSLFNSAPGCDLTAATAVPLVLNCGQTPTASGTAGGEQRSFGFKNMNVTGFHLEGGDANNVASFVTNQVHCQPLNEEAGFFLDVLLVQRVQHGVTGAVCRCASSLNGFFAIVGGVAAKRTLVNRAVRVAVKRHAHVLQVINNLGGFTAHVFNSVLVAKPVRTFDGVIEMVVPVVLGHVAERGANATLRRHGVRARREHCR